MDSFTKTCTATTGAFDAIGALFVKLKAFGERLKVVTREEMSNDLEPVLRAILVNMLGIIALASQRTYHGLLKDEDVKERHHTWHHFKKKVAQNFLMTTSEYAKQLFLGGDGKINAAMADLSRLIDEEARMTQAVTFDNTVVTKKLAITIEGLSVGIAETTQRMAETTQRTETKVDTLSSDVKAGLFEIMATLKEKRTVAGEREDTRVQKMDRFVQSGKVGGAGTKGAASKDVDRTGHLRELLEPADEKIYDDIRHHIIPRTAIWILEDPRVKSWIAREHPIVCIQGESGSGKSFLAARIIEHMEEKFPQGKQDASRISVAHFFCKSVVPKLDNVDSLLRTVAYHLALNDQAYAKQIWNADLGNPWDDERLITLWQTLFRQPFSASTQAPAYVIIDGIDECREADRNALFSAMESTVAEGTGEWPLNLRFLFLDKSGAPESLVKKLALGVPSVSCREARNPEDISIFTQNRMEAAWKDKLISTQLFDEAQGKVQSYSEGNFLWVSLVVQELASLSREDVVRQRLDDLPKNLPAAMVMTLHRLSEELDVYDVEDLSDILAWVVCAHRDLTLVDLDALLYIRKPSGARVIDLEDKLQNKLRSLFVLSGVEDQSPEGLHYRLRHRLAVGTPTTAADVPAIDGGSDVDVLEIDRDTVVDEPPLLDLGPDLELGADPVKRRLAAMAQTKVRLLHTRIAEYVQDSKVHEGHVDFTTSRMRVKVLLACLGLLCDDKRQHPKDIFTTATQYCFLWVADHFADMQSSDMDQSTKLIVAKLFLRLLREDTLIAGWTAVAENCMLQDLLLKDDPKFVTLLATLLNSEDVYPSLSENDRAFIDEAKFAPVKTYLSYVAAGIAKRWLQSRDGDYAYQFEFLNAFASIVAEENRSPAVKVAEKPSVASEGPSPEESIHQDFEQISTTIIQVQDDASPDGPLVAEKGGEGVNASEGRLTDYSLENTEVEKVIQIARSFGFEENALWYACVGAAVRETGHPREALPFYETAISMDNEDPLTRAGLATTYSKLDKPDEAIENLKAATALFEKRLADSSQDTSDSGTELRYWYYSYLSDLAFYCVGKKRFDEAIHSHEAAFAGWESMEPESADWYEVASAAVACVSTMVAAGQFENAADLLENRFLKHPKRSTRSFAWVWEQLLSIGTTIARIAFETHRSINLDQIYAVGLQSLARHGSQGSCAAIRYHRAFSLTMLHPEQQERAMSLLEWVWKDHEIDVPSSGWYSLKEVAELTMARLYLNMILEAREIDQWSRVGRYAQELVDLVGGDIGTDGTRTLSTRKSSLILGAWNRVNGRMDRAKSCVKGILTNGIVMLSDNDPENDAVGWQRLANSLLVVGDARAAAATLMMRTIDRFGNAVADTALADHAKQDDSMPMVDKNTVPAPNAELAGNGPKIATAETNNGTGNWELEPQASAGAQVQRDETDRGSSVVGTGYNEVTQPTMPATNGDALDNAPGGRASEDTQVTTTDINSSDGSTTQDPTETASWYSCDGPCFKDIFDKDDMWRCSYCISDFCNHCHRLVMEGNTQGWAVCGRLHQHIMMPGAKSKFPKDRLKVNDVFVPVSEFLDELKKDWNIE